MRVHHFTIITLLLATGALAAEPCTQPSVCHSNPRHRARAAQASPEPSNGGSIPRHRARAAQASPEPSNGGSIPRHRARAAQASPQPSDSDPIPRRSTPPDCEKFQVFSSKPGNFEYRGTPTCCCSGEICNLDDAIDGIVASATLDEEMGGVFMLRSRGGDEGNGSLELGTTTYTVKRLGGGC